jgi:hypothetical protein
MRAIAYRSIAPVHVSLWMLQSPPLAKSNFLEPASCRTSRQVDLTCPTLVSCATKSNIHSVLLQPLRTAESMVGQTLNDDPHTMSVVTCALHAAQTFPAGDIW